MTAKTVMLDKVIAPAFYDLYYDISENLHTHYWIKGGRGSTKSSFVSCMLVMGMMQNENANAVVIRKVGMYLKDSVYEQLVWAIDKLKVAHKWRCKLSPLEIIYVPTGQRILFRGADKPRKLKSTKVSKGYIKYIWYEEVDEFNGIEEIRTINQSLMRGGRAFNVFYTYNPPKSQRNWVNEEVLVKQESKAVHHSTYLDVPKNWLGEQFFIEAEHLRNTKPESYAHEYMGEITGTGGTVFTNVNIKELTDEEIDGFDRIKRGVDFGYAIDPFVYIVCHYDSKYKRLFVFDEIYKSGLSNEKAFRMIDEKKHYSQPIVCDSAEPKSIAEFRGYGLRVVPAKKGPDSVEYGIKFLQSLEEIVIDNVRCPNTAKEFYEYELESDNNGGFKSQFPDINNHAIDAVRYAMEDEITRRKAKILNRKDFGI